MKKKYQFSLFKKYHFSLSVMDFAAIAVFLLLGSWFIWIIPRGINVSDESFYYTIPQRLMQGDRLFVDEWQVSQLNSLFQYIPYRLFVWFVGSNEGIIVFMRSLAIIVALLMYWFVYKKLKNYGFWSIAVAFLMGVYFPAGVLALSYYTIPVYGMMIVCLTLFPKKKQLRMWQLVLVGIALACAVLSQPIFSLLYLMFSLLCLVHAIKPHFLKNYDFVINAKVWKGLTLGCLIAFVLVVGGILLKSGPRDFFKTIPELFTDVEYDFSAGGYHMELMFSKFKDGLRLFGNIFVIGSLILCAIIALNRFLIESVKTKVYFFVAACALFVAEIWHAFGLTVHASVVSDSDITFFQFVFSFSLASDLFALMCYLLCEKKNPRIFAFWVTGMLMSLLVNFASMAFLTFGGMLCSITLLLSLKELWEEGKILKRDVSKKKHKNIRELRLEKRKSISARVWQTSAIIALCFVIFWGSMNAYVEGIKPFVETIGSNFSQTKFTQTIQKGPHKGVKTVPGMQKTYEKILSDLDKIKADSAGKPFYAAGNCSFYYLYLNLPVGTYSTWYVTNDSQTRQLRYWKLHPEKRPRYCYVPLYVDSLCFTKTWEEEQARMDEKLEFLQSISKCSIEKGKAGYIVKIQSWNF